MKYIFILVLSGCTSPNYGFTTMVCPKNEVGCQVGGKNFYTLAECEEFLRQSSKFQPNVGRICVKANRPNGVW